MTTIPAPTTPARPASIVTSEEVAAALRGSGLPIADLTTYTAESDPNALLGRPGQYVAKVNWRDTRIPAEADTARLEVFADAKAQAAWYAHNDALLRSGVPQLAGYIYRNDRMLAVLRLPRELTPDQAAEYKQWLEAVTF